MIIGNGLLAKSLREVDKKDVTVFCSGVSNSSEENDAAFEREKTLLLNQPKNHLLVYFSTTSIFNPAKKASKYISHKVEIETLIAAHFKTFLILRLPNVIGSSGNEDTLFPFFYHSIQRYTQVAIQENARRQLLSANDLPVILDAMLNNNLTGIFNTCLSETPTVLDIYLLMCKQLQKPPNYTLIEGEPIFEVDNTEFQKFMTDKRVDNLTSWQDTISHFTLLLAKGGDLEQGIRP